MRFAGANIAAATQAILAAKNAAFVGSAIQPETGLDWPGSGSGTIRFQFSSPPDPYDASYLWKYFPRSQNSYYTNFFYGDGDGGFNSQETYYGFHPYPDPPVGGTRKWEIAADGGGDFLGAAVVYDTWYDQGARCFDNSGTLRNEYYWNLPDTSTDIIVRDHTSGPYDVPDQPVIVWGDAPWNAGNEVNDGIVRGIQIYTSKLSLAHMLLLRVCETDAQVLAVIAANSIPGLWYLNMNPTPTDISDKSGNGNNPAWVGAGRPTLYTA